MGSTSSSIMSTPRSDAASKLSIVLPARTASAPLCPIRFTECRRVLTVAARLGSNENEAVPSDTEIRNRRITAVLLVVGAAIAILAAADVGPFADETEEDRVREAVERFIAARDEGDLATVCGMLTPTLKREVQATSGARPGTRPPTCAQVLDARAEAGSSRDRGS